MADSSLAVVKGVIAALKADASVTGLNLAGIYTDVPQAAAFPYVVVSMESEPFASASFSGQSHRVRLQCFSRADSAEECLAIRAACLNALDRKEGSIPVAGNTVVIAQLSDFSTFFQEDDGRTWQGVGELEIVVQ